ncbi:MAG: hypothetical protein AB8B85_06475 [Paracoccaceae bacterium]
MSNVGDREQALQEQKYLEASAKTIKQLELRKAYQSGQGEFLGDMIGGFGALTGGKGRLLVGASQLTIICGVGIMFILVLL